MPYAWIQKWRLLEICLNFGLTNFSLSPLGSVLLFSILNNGFNRNITSGELKRHFQSQVLSIISSNSIRTTSIPCCSDIYNTPVLKANSALGHAKKPLHTLLVFIWLKGSVHRPSLFLQVNSNTSPPDQITGNRYLVTLYSYTLNQAPLSGPRDNINYNL